MLNIIQFYLTTPDMCFAHTINLNVEIREQFVSFDAVEDTREKGLCENIKVLLTAEALELSDCNGQGCEGVQVNKC